jgi:hypothetical protein
MRLAIDQALKKGMTIALHTVDLTGRPHVCTVYPIRRKKR